MRDKLTEEFHIKQKPHFFKKKKNSLACDCKTQLQKIDLEFNCGISSHKAKQVDIILNNIIYYGNQNIIF